MSETDLSVYGRRRFEVETILDHEISAGELFFQIKWAGWSSLYNTWEPSRHLTHCSQKVIDYQRTLKPFVIAKPPDVVPETPASLELPQ
jgi:hypothetical protein